MTPEHLMWNNAVDRILRSGHAGLEKHQFFGLRYDTGLPLLVPTDRDNQHTWILGATGTGKSARVLVSQIAQAIAAGKSVVVFDPKPDKAMFESCRWECHQQGIPFRYVDVRPGHWSYSFPPLAQSHAAAQTIASRSEILIQSFNLDYGAMYGGAYFTSMEEGFIRAVLTHFPNAQSPEEVARLFDHPAPLIKQIGEKGWEDSNHVRSYFTKLAGVSSLNVTPRTRGVYQAALDNAIDLRQPFYAPQVIYFVLDSTQLRTTSRTVLGLGFYNLMAAAKHVGPTPPVEVCCVIDEAQEVIGPNLSILLEQSRSMGIQLVLAHQHLGQLIKTGADYRSTLEENTGVQIVLNPKGRDVQEWIEQTGGETTYRSIGGWDQKMRPGFFAQRNPPLDPRYAMWPSLFDYPTFRVSIRSKPVWDRTTLRTLSSIRGLSWVRVAHNKGFAQDYGQWVPTWALFHIDANTFTARKNSPWPGPSPETVQIQRNSAFDRRFEEPPAPPPRAAERREDLRRFREEN